MAEMCHMQMHRNKTVTRENWGHRRKQDEVTGSPRGYVSPLWSTALVLLHRKESMEVPLTTAVICAVSHHFSIHDSHSDAGVAVFEFSCISAFSA